MKRLSLLLIVLSMSINSSYAMNGELKLVKSNPDGVLIHLHVKCIGGAWLLASKTPWKVIPTPSFEYTLTDTYGFGFDSPTDANDGSNGTMPWSKVEFTIGTDSHGLTFTIDLADENWSDVFKDRGPGPDLYLYYDHINNSAYFYYYGNLTTVENKTYYIRDLYFQSGSAFTDDLYPMVLLKNAINESDAGGFLHVNAYQYGSNDAAPISFENSFTIRTDADRLASHPGYKHHDWRGIVTGNEFKLSRSVFVSPSNVDQTAKFIDFSTVTLQTVMDGINTGSFDFLDPWYVETDGSQLGTFNTFPSPYQPTGARNEPSGGVFLNQNLTFDPNIPIYSIRALLVNTNINGFTGYFQNWQYDLNKASLGQMGSTSGYDQKAVVFKQAGATITATYKAHLGTGSSSLADTKNQRRVLSDGSNWVMVYESMGDIWITYSGDGGGTWSPEQKINSIIGQASNPTISNVASNSKATVAWIENNQGTAELHLQNIRIQTGSTGQAIWFGWNGYAEVPGPSNHKTINALPLNQGGYPFAWRARLDARPVLFLASDASSILVAVERNGSGIMAPKVVMPTAVFNTAYVLQEGLGGGGRAVSASTADKYPVIISYPSVYGFPASTRIFYLAWGYGAGHRIAQYDYLARSTSLVTGEYGEYAYYSLQGSVSSANGSFVLVAEDLNGYSGQHNVCVFFKPTYYGSSLPSLGTTYTNKVQPSVMAEPGGFGSPPTEVNMKSATDGTWYKGISGSLTTLGTSIAGMFLREQIPSGNHPSMAVRTSATPPSHINYYSGVGILSKTSGNQLATNVRAFRFWKDKNQLDRMAVLDFSGSTVDFLDTLQNADNFCVAQLSGPFMSNTFVRQIDSLKTTMTVDIMRGGKSQFAFAPSSWSSLSVADLRQAQMGDLVRFSIDGPMSEYRGYQEISLVNDELNKDAAEVTQPIAEEHLKKIEEGIGVYPNPFNPSTNFRISLPSAQRVHLAVYNVVGQMVGDVVNGDLEAGEHVYNFNGSRLSSGVYFYRCMIGEKVTSGRPLLLK